MIFIVHLMCSTVLSYVSIFFNNHGLVYEIAAYLK